MLFKKQGARKYSIKQMKDFLNKIGNFPTIFGFQLWFYSPIHLPLQPINQKI